ncbi:MAG: prolyl aminopeptidase [Gammaproteobacteria bacterium]|jgi:proline iminopeptidase|nr:prolyl aminopeptidase [Gammaproteobacteria bacterium]
MELLELYPSIEPYHEFQLKVDELHTVWIEECGNPHGLPVVFLHGGPGAACEAFQRRFFDPKYYRIILFDQRGCGRSTPHAELRNNTTQDLVADIERIRNYLNIEKWLVFGGSWGSTLALAYAQAHANRVTGLILRGVFLCRSRDIQWFYQDGASYIYPDLWQHYIQVIPEEERDDLLAAFYKRLICDDEEIQIEAARAWSIWEGSTSNLITKPAVLNYFSNDAIALSLARIECHYFNNDSFLRKEQLLKDAYKLENIPGVIVHGRYDVVCPIEQAFALHQAWPSAEFIIAQQSGHSATEPEIVDALIRATQKFGQLT